MWFLSEQSVENYVLFMFIPNLWIIWNIMITNNKSPLNLSATIPISVLLL